MNTFEEFKNESFTVSAEENAATIKKLLPAEDVPVYRFTTGNEAPCALIYADGMVNKQLLGDLAARPLAALKSARLTLEKIKKTVLFPELKTAKTPADAAREILDGNALLLCEGIPFGLIIGAKLVPVRAVSEPQTSIAVKGPREGFIEDVKTNMVLVRKRLKTGNLRFEYVRIGKQSDTAIVLCYLEGIADKKIVEAVKKRLGEIEMDVVIDSSYIAAFLAPRRHSPFKSAGTTEKPDIFSAKIAEGRIGILADGSPIALTVPYLLTEDLQSGEDYFISPFAATVFRLLRVFALFAALFLPAFYVASQLFKMQLIPLNLTLTIAGSTRGLPLSPSLETFLVLLVFEILKEASIRMPKYVGLALSVVGALVLGDTAVSAGFVSTPAIIVVAFSGICLYTVPDFVETGSILRWIFLIAAGSVGPFGIVLAAAFVLYYLITADSFGAPLLAPFSPMIAHDLKDALLKEDAYSLQKRPAVFRSANKRRMRLNVNENTKNDEKTKKQTGTVTDAQKIMQKAKNERRKKESEP